MYKPSHSSGQRDNFITVACSSGAGTADVDSDELNSQPSCEVDEQGNQRWYSNGQLHRTAGPAVVWASGTQWWYQNGLLHRTDGPAIIAANGTQVWYQNGQHHRIDGPAVI